MNAGRNAEALENLEQMADGQEQISAHFGFSLDMARYRSGEYALALEALLKVVELQSDHALALDVAAHCAFLVGEAKTGRRLAKRAFELGRTETYSNWRKGKYHRERVQM